MPYKSLEQQREYTRRKRAEYRGSLDTSRKRQRSHIWTMTQKEWEDKVKQNAQRGHQKLRMEVLIHYSGSPPKCACCAETTLEFLTIDHIDGGGHCHRQFKRNLYRWLKKHNFPEGFRVLCWNCNGSLGMYGYCPHG